MLDCCCTAVFWWLVLATVGCVVSLDVRYVEMRRCSRQPHPGLSSSRRECGRPFLAAYMLDESYGSTERAESSTCSSSSRAELS